MSADSGILGITGTPGTGKKSVARGVARALRIEALGVDDLARSHRAIKRSGGDLVVDTVALRRRLARDLPRNAVVYGHLLPHVLQAGWVGRVAVLRTEPSVLKERLEARGYTSTKVVGNVEAELIGLVSADAFSSFGAKAFEADTTYTSPGEASALVVEGFSRRGPRRERIDWTPSYDSGQKLRSLLSGG